MDCPSLRKRSDGPSSSVVSVWRATDRRLRNCFASVRWFHSRGSSSRSSIIVTSDRQYFQTFSPIVSHWCDRNERIRATPQKGSPMSGLPLTRRRLDLQCDSGFGLCTSNPSAAEPPPGDPCSRRNARRGAITCGCIFRGGGCFCRLLRVDWKR